jgi:hypothetical protein
VRKTCISYVSGLVKKNVLTQTSAIYVFKVGILDLDVNVKVNAKTKRILICFREIYKVFQNDCDIVGCRIGKNSLPPFHHKVPYYATPNITSKPLASVKYHFCHSLLVVNIQKFTRK